MGVIRCLRLPHAVHAERHDPRVHCCCVWVKLFRAQAASLHRETMRSFWARHWTLLLLMLPAVVTPLVDQWFLLVMHEDVPSFSTTPNVTEIITTW